MRPEVAEEVVEDEEAGEAQLGEEEEEVVLQEVARMLFKLKPALKTPSRTRLRLLPLLLLPRSEAHEALRHLKRQSSLHEALAWYSELQSAWKALSRSRQPYNNLKSEATVPIRQKDASRHATQEVSFRPVQN